MNPYQIALIAFFLVMNGIGFFSMAIDKMKAKQGSWRIPEATLFLIALLFGGVGSTLGMFVMRHKTKHWYFRLGFPLLAIVSIAAFVFLFKTLAPLS